MYIVIQHDIQDPQLFQNCAEAVFPLPDHLQLHHFLPSADMKKAVCLYEAPSVENLSTYLDAKLNPASKQFYFPVLTEHAMGLPKSVNA
jgi:hypothetical protein